MLRPNPSIPPCQGGSRELTPGMRLHDLNIDMFLKPLPGPALHPLDQPPLRVLHRLSLPLLSVGFCITLSRFLIKDYFRRSPYLSSACVPCPIVVGRTSRGRGCPRPLCGIFCGRNVKRFINAMAPLAGSEKWKKRAVRSSPPFPLVSSSPAVMARATRRGNPDGLGEAPTFREAEPLHGLPRRAARVMTEFPPPQRERPSGSPLFQPVCGQDGRVPG